MANSSVSELERIAERLKACDKDFKDRENKLEEERRKIDSEKKVAERAIRESESALRLAEERKKENDELCCRITELKNNLESSTKSTSIWMRQNRRLNCMIAELQKNHEDDIKLAGKQKEENEELRSRINEVKEKHENALKLAREQEMEKEQLQKRFTLQKKLQSKKALKLVHEVIREFDENGELGCEDKMDGEVERENKTDTIRLGSTEKDKYIEHLEALNNILTVKEMKSNDELQAARKALVNGFLDSQAYIGVKTMGTLDSKPFQTAVKRQYVAKRAKKKPAAYKVTVGKGTTEREYEQATIDEQDNIDQQAVELCTLWEDYLRDASWHPFKVIRVGGDHKEVIDVEDEKLKTLREELGNEAYEAVTTALIEMNDYNPSGRYPVREFWNFKEERKATVLEGVTYLQKHLKLYKRRRTSRY